MGKISIYRNGVAVAVCEKLEYSGSWMGECFVTVTVTSPTPIDFQIGDYITYRNEVFVLNNVPTVSKKASSGSYGEAFTYENVKLSARSTELTDVMFLDVVLADNNIHYTALPDFPFFSSDIEDFADRMQANTNQWCTANGLELSDYWLFITPNLTRFIQRAAHLRIDNNDNWEGLTASQAHDVFTASYPYGVSRDGEKKNVNLTVSSKRVWDMMSEIKNSFGLNFITRGRHVVIGAKGVKADHIFEYGKGNGLYEIERTADTEQQVITKLYSYGTEKNMPVRYYANLNLVCFATVTKVSVEDETFYVIDIPYSRGCYTDKRHFEIGIFSGRLKNHNYYVAHATKDEDEYNLGICSVDEYKEELLEKVSAENRARAEEYLSEWSDATHSLIFGRYETEELDFSTNDELIFVSGMNKDKWPSMKRTTPDGEQALPNNMSVSKLMLPGFPLVSLRNWVEEHKNDEDKSWLRDAIERGYTFSREQYNPYILSPNVSVLGIRESSKSFDGSEEDEVYPTIENTGKDHLLSAETVTDNGIFDDGDTTPTVEITLPFNVDEFNLKELATTGVQDGGSPTISIKSGYCGGCEFSFNDGDVTEVNSHWKVKCERYKNDLLGIYFPYSYNASIGTTPTANEAFQLRGSVIDFYDGDKYVLTGIPMTDFYIEKAAEKLLQLSLVFLSKNDYTRYTYSPKVDELFMAREHDKAVAETEEGSPVESLYMTLKEGDLMDFKDTDLNIEGSVFIDTLVITENGNNGIPTYQVTLRNDKTVGTIQRLQEKVDSLVSGGITVVSGSVNGGSSGGGSISNQQLQKIYQWVEEKIEQAASSGAVLSQDITSNAPKVGHVETGSTFQHGTPIEDVLRTIFFKSRDAAVSVSCSPSEPKVGQSVTLTANFDGGTGGLTAVSYQWYMDGEEIEGATGTTYTFTAEETQHSFYCVVTLSDDSTRTSNSVNIKGSVTLASLAVSVASAEAEVGSQVTVTAVITPGTNATSVNSITFNGNSIQNPSGRLTFSEPMTVREGANTCDVIVTMNDNTRLTDQVVYTGYYKWFAGKVSTQNYNSVDIGSLSHSGFIKTNPNIVPNFEIMDWTGIAVAVPSSHNVTKLSAVTDGFESNMLSNPKYMSSGTKTYSTNNTQYTVIVAYATSPTDKSTVKIETT